MPTAPDKRHPAPPSPHQASPDINTIPPPNGSVAPGAPAQPAQPPLAQPAQPPPAQTTQPAPDQAAMPVLPQFGMSSTQVVIALALVLAWAGLLLLVKRLLTQSLVAQFADLGRSRAAGTTLYVFLLVLGATVVFCALGSFWQVLAVVIPAVALNLVLLVLFLWSLASARSSRQRLR